MILSAVSEQFLSATSPATITYAPLGETELFGVNVGSTNQVSTNAHTASTIPDQQLVTMLKDLECDKSAPGEEDVEVDTRTLEEYALFRWSTLPKDQNRVLGNDKMRRDRISVMTLV